LNGPGSWRNGATREEAARQIQLALEGALEVAAEEGNQTASAGARARLGKLVTRYYAIDSFILLR